MAAEGKYGLDVHALGRGEVPVACAPGSAQHGTAPTDTNIAGFNELAGSRLR